VTSGSDEGDERPLLGSSDRTDESHDAGPDRAGPESADGAAGRSDEGAPEALQGVQQAAHQMISAARGLLDAFEALVDDPATVRDAVSVVGGLAQEAARMAADAGRRAAQGHPAPGASTGGDQVDDPPDDGPVQRIDVR